MVKRVGYLELYVCLAHGSLRLPLFAGTLRAYLRQSEAVLGGPPNTTRHTHIAPDMPTPTLASDSRRSTDAKAALWRPADRSTPQAMPTARAGRRRRFVGEDEGEWQFCMAL